jgi:uncharacterized protein YggE
MKILYSILACFLCQHCLIAEEPPRIPLISVTGTSELNVAPDLIRITVDIDNREKSLVEAKAKTDGQAKKLIDLAKSHQVSDEDIVTGYVAMSPVRNYRKNEGRAISYFQAAQRITITLKDFSKYDSLMDAMVGEGFGDAYVEYDVADMPSYRKKARIDAILAARGKAGILAEAVGQKIGKAYEIKEAAFGNTYARPNVSSNSVSRISSNDELAGGSPLSVGNIKISITVEASFYLE